jgi:hypothetical protein
MIAHKDDGSIARNVLSANDFDLAEEDSEDEVEEPLPEPIQIHGSGVWNKSRACTATAIPKAKNTAESV